MTKPHYEILNNRINVWLDYPDYRDKYAGKMSAINDKRWVKERKCWSFLLSMGMINKLNEIFGLSIAEIEPKAIVTKEPIPLEMVEYDTPVPPFKHQKIATSMMFQQERIALFMEMGTGKTKCVVDWFANALDRKLVDNMLIICPKTVMVSWVEELKAHKIENYVLLQGTKKQRIMKLGGALINIINYEGVLVLDKYLDYFCTDRTAVVLDESSKIKSPQAQRTKMIVKKFVNNRYKFILSGTPITQNPIDIYSQYKFCDADWLPFQSWYSFRNYYCIMGGHMKFQIIGYRHLEELKQLIADHSYIIKKTDTDCNLPPKLYQVRSLEMKPEMETQYNKMKKDLIIEIVNEEKITASIILVKLLRLQQIISGQWLEKQSDNVKLQEIIDIIKQTDSKVIVWCRFIPSIKLIHSLLDKAGIKNVMFYGETIERDEVVKSFQEGDIRIFIGQLQTGGMGLNLQAANLVIYYENSFSLQDRLQSEDRCHRIGQVNKVTYIDLIYTGTIDQDIIGAIKNKKKIADYLIPQFKEVK